jgi:hypothetical protein
MPQKPVDIYQIKVTLDTIRPPIWRRILVSGNTTLLKLHDIIQIIMGWEDDHLHMFTIHGSIYGNPEDDEYGELGTRDEAKVKLSQVIQRDGQRFAYEYDFGDSWEHTLLVEKILPAEEGVHYPICVKGKRACPPEDMGGVWGYVNFVEAISDPKHPEHDEYLEWVGDDFDPEAFNLNGVNAQLSRMGRGRSAKLQDFWVEDEEQPAQSFSETAFAWMHSLSDEQRNTANNLALRKDMITLLSYLRDNKVTGTQSTGNFPLKDVREICSRFISPPKLEEAIGEQVYRIRSEADVWPLYYRHVLASNAGLIVGGLGRRWTLTSLGNQFLAAPAEIQTWLLALTWWTQTNWAIAFPYGYGDGYMPYGFSKLVTRHLLDLPAESRVPFEPFADQLITKTGLVWPIQDQNSARQILHGLIERIVIDPMIDFGVVQAEYQPSKILGEGYRELATFEITPFGKSLLESMDDIQQE